MFTFETFGITPAFVTGVIVFCAVGLCALAAIGILLWCLFGIGLSRIAKSRGEEKEWYAFLPLLRLYTLGKMIKGNEKTKKVFACLLPSVAVARFVMSIISTALLMRAAAGLVFSAESMPGSVIQLSSLISFPIMYCVGALVITAILAAAQKIIAAVCYFGAFEGAGRNLAIVFTVLTFICCPLGAIFLYVASKKSAEAANVQADAE